MTKEFIESLIIWGPTILFALSLGFYFLAGVLRGLRKSVIFLIHTTASMALFVILFFSIVNSENVDVTMVNIVNYVMNLFGTSVQNVLGVSEEPVAINTRMVLEKGITMLGRSRSTREDFCEAVRIMEEDAKLTKRLSLLISKDMKVQSIKDVELAFETARTVDYKVVMELKI